jgi:PPOX class probable F420-dependent enzyme
MCVVSPCLHHRVLGFLLPLPGRLPSSLLHFPPARGQATPSHSTVHHVSAKENVDGYCPRTAISPRERKCRPRDVAARWTSANVARGAGRAIISSQETTAKVRNLRRDPRATLCVFVEAFRGPWVQIEGTAEIVTLPDAMEPLLDYYRRLAGEHPDWDDYRRAMMADRRALIRITIERAGPDRQG